MTTTEQTKAQPSEHGTPFHNLATDTIEFKNVPALNYDAVREAELKALNKLREAAAKSPDDKELEAVATAFDRLKNQEPTRTVRESGLLEAERKSIEAALAKETPEEYKTMEAAYKELNKAKVAQRAAQNKLVKGMTELQDSHGQPVEAAKLKTLQHEFHGKTNEFERLHTPTTINTNFAEAREVGKWSALKKNFSGEYIKGHKLAFGGKVVTAALGVALMGDGVFRGTAKDNEGKEQHRGLVMRAGEFAGGAALTAGSLLHGGR